MRDAIANELAHVDVAPGVIDRGVLVGREFRRLLGLHPLVLTHVQMLRDLAFVLVLRLICVSPYTHCALLRNFFVALALELLFNRWFE